MKINPKKVLKHYKNWLQEVSKDNDWKDSIDSKEIVYKICSIIENEDVEEDVDLLSFEEIKNLAKQPRYGVYHKPTKLWVYFRELKDKFGIVVQSIICLCLKVDATLSTDKDRLKNLIEMGEFNSDTLYGKEKFSEFQIKKL
jgi:hypothetical protein